MLSKILYKILPNENMSLEIDCFASPLISSGVNLETYLRMADVVCLIDRCQMISSSIAYGNSLSRISKNDTIGLTFTINNSLLGTEPVIEQYIIWLNIIMWYFNGTV